MDADLNSVYLQVMQANQPEDLFGCEDVVLPEATLLKYLKGEYGKFKRLTKPSLYHDPLDVEAATDADARLEELYSLAQTRIGQHVYGIEGRGKRHPTYAVKSFTVGANRYFIGNLLRGGEDSNLYEGFMERDGLAVGEVVIKVAKDQSFNPLLQTEVRNLDLLHETPVPQWKHLPFVMDRFQSGGRVGLVFRKIGGFSLAEVRAHRTHVKGVDRKHIVWMLDRGFSCLGYVHRLGLVHGNLSPEHFIVQPPSHNAIICGWKQAVHKPAVTGEKVIAIPGEFTAPEVAERGKIGPWSDIYSLGKLMIWTLGGDTATNTIPDSVEEPLRRFLLSLVEENHLVRPADAWSLYEQQCKIKDSLWPRKFLHFDMA